jgi:hypothetical protein
MMLKIVGNGLCLKIDSVTQSEITIFRRPLIEENKIPDVAEVG